LKTESNAKKAEVKKEEDKAEVSVNEKGKEPAKPALEKNNTT